MSRHAQDISDIERGHRYERDARLIVSILGTAIAIGFGAMLALWFIDAGCHGLDCGLGALQFLGLLPTWGALLGIVVGRYLHTRDTAAGMVAALTFASMVVHVMVAQPMLLWYRDLYAPFRPLDAWGFFMFWGFFTGFSALAVWFAALPFGRLVERRGDA